MLLDHTRPYDDSSPDGPEEQEVPVVVVLNSPGPHRAGTEIPLGSELTVGRSVCGPGTLTVEDEAASGSHFRIVRDGVQLRIIDTGSTNGTFVEGEPVVDVAVSPGSIVRAGDTVLLVDLARPSDGPVATLPQCVPPGRQMGRVARKLRATVERRTDPTGVIRLMGEQGTGKEVLARTAHQASRRQGAFVAVNCKELSGALMDDLIRGSLRGSYTGSVQDRKGVFVAADGGTLLLDEVADLEPAAQTALLRIVQERVVTPIGTNTPVPFDVQLIVATNKDIDGMVAAGSWRSDLLGRISRFIFMVPPMRARRDEILPLFLYRYGGAPDMSGTFAERLLLAEWPDNVRGVEHLAENLLVNCGRPRRLVPAHLFGLDRYLGGMTRTAPAPWPALRATGAPTPLELRELLIRYRGKVMEMCAATGTARATMYRLLKDAGLNPRSFR